MNPNHDLQVEECGIVFTHDPYAFVNSDFDNSLLNPWQDGKGFFVCAGKEWGGVNVTVVSGDQPPSRSLATAVSEGWEEGEEISLPELAGPVYLSTQNRGLVTPDPVAFVEPCVRVRALARGRRVDGGFREVSEYFEVQFWTESGPRPHERAGLDLRWAHTVPATMPSDGASAQHDGGSSAHGLDAAGPSIREVREVPLAEAVGSGPRDAPTGADDLGQVVPFFDPTGVPRLTRVTDEQGAVIAVGYGLLVGDLAWHLAAGVEPDMAVRVDEAGDDPRNERGDVEA